MRVIFLGTPDFAVPTLDALNKSNHEILAVITQPDKAKNRGMELAYSPVKKYAKENGLDVLQYNKIRVDGVNDLKQLAPDIMVTCAYGQILSQEVIDIPKYGIINVHASLLPKYRGAAPIAWAIINGEKKTGITLMKTEKGIDTGDMLLKVETEIGEDETAGELFDRLSEMGGPLLIEGLNQIENGTANFVAQNHEEASHCSMLKKEDGRINFKKSASEIHNLVRGLSPWPVAFFEMDKKRIKVYKTQLTDIESDEVAGTVVKSSAKEGLFIKCNEGVIEITELQFPNSKRMDAKSFLNGHMIKVGTIL